MNIADSQHNIKAYSNKEQRGEELFPFVRDLFEGDARFEHVRRLALRVRKLTEEIDPLIEELTSEVCPSCKEVCCINRHGHYAFDDLIYIAALGIEPLQCKADIADTAPCRFLGQKGCLFKRSVRPFRCNWYFCASLLRHMEELPAKVYRNFLLKFQELQEQRQEMLTQFSVLSKGLL